MEEKKRFRPSLTMYRQLEKENECLRERCTVLEAENYGLKHRGLFARLFNR